YDPFNKRVITPVSRVWNEAWGGWVLFDWDTYFTAAMYALDNKYHAYSNAIAITNEITDRGFIPNYSASLSNSKSYDRSQPPVGSLICKMIYDKYQEKWFLNEVYDNLLTWNRWWEKARDNQGFLSWGSDPDQRVQGDNSKKAAQFESGLDNSPLFDSAVYNEKTHKLELASVGLMSMYIADCKSLAGIADVLGKADDQEELLARAEKYSLKLNELWDENSGIYRDKNLVTGKFSSRLAPTNFYPLLSGVPTEEQAERMVSEHLLNPEEFNSEYMIPSVSINDPAYKDNSYWRGRIWGPMNFIVYLGLRNYDLPEARKILAEKSYNLIMKGWNKDRHVYENYNSVTGEGADVRNSDGFYSWGGLLALIPLMEAGYWDTNGQ
ncbi:MAG TPA: trehalase family glycosidase, partial [Bacteroidales bacterium]|nr:trehalase family glycosidase [Bacteroidales bacterium]